jgi:HSP20 family protein
MFSSVDGDSGSAPGPATDFRPALAKRNRASRDLSTRSVHRSKEDSVMATLTRWNDYSNAFDLMTDIRRHFGTLLDEPARRSVVYGFSWPHVACRNAGESFELEADVPGMTEKDVEVSIDQGIISIKGERKSQHGDPEVTFARSFSLPAEIDAEKATATVRHGVLTVVLPKAAAIKPRRIEVKAG